MTDHDNSTKPKNDWQAWLDTWVWYCDQTSIDAGKISALAIVETFAAVGLWWWLAMHFNWSIFSFVALFAAPMLLLRSPESIADGVAMLARYWQREKDISKAEKVFFVIYSALITGGLTYWLSHWLPSHMDWNWLMRGAVPVDPLLNLLANKDWNWFWRGAVLSMVSFAFAGAFAGVFVGMGAGTGAAGIKVMFEETVNTVFVGMMVGMLAAFAVLILTSKGGQHLPFAFTLTLAVLVALAFTTNGGSVEVAVSVTVVSAIAAASWEPVAAAFVILAAVSFLNMEAVLVAPFFALGIFLYSQFIGVLATLYHPLQGLECLPRNWRNTLWVIDLSHPPELLPQAETISDFFAVKSLWRGMWMGEFRNSTPFFVMFLLVFYLPTLMYRWSLKASAWLWFPLILLLKPPFYGMTEQDFRERIALSVKGIAWVALRVLAGLVLLWLLAALSPNLINWMLLVKDLGEGIQKSLALMMPPPLGIRYIALWLFAGLGLWFAKSCDNLKTLHSEWLEKPEQPADATTEVFARFQRRARTAERLRIALIVTVIVGGYAFAAMWLHDKNPTYANHFLAPWLLRIL